MIKINDKLYFSFHMIKTSIQNKSLCYLNYQQQQRTKNIKYYKYTKNSSIQFYIEAPGTQDKFLPESYNN